MGVENSDHNAKRENGSPILRGAINKAMSPDRKDGVLKAIDMMGAVPSSLEELNASPALHDMLDQTSSPEGRTGVLRTVVAAGAVKERERMEESEAAALIADFFKAYLPGYRKVDIVESLRKLQHGGLVLNKDERRRFMDIFVSKVLPDYPELSDEGKGRLGKLVREKGFYYVMKNMFIENLRVIDRVKALGSPEGVLQKLEGYAADMMEIQFLGVVTPSAISAEIGYRILDMEKKNGSVVIEERKWEWQQYGNAR